MVAEYPLLHSLSIISDLSPPPLPCMSDSGLEEQEFNTDVSSARRRRQ